MTGGEENLGSMERGRDNLQQERKEEKGKENVRVEKRETQVWRSVWRRERERNERKRDNF